MKRRCDVSTSHSRCSQALPCSVSTTSRGPALTVVVEPVVIVSAGSSCTSARSGAGALSVEIDDVGSGLKKEQGRCGGMPT